MSSIPRATRSDAAGSAALLAAATAFAAALIAAAGLWIYRSTLWPARPELRYPWSSDTWGHLIKALFLDTQVRAGHWYPDIFPAWYNGVQLLRYYAPAPYYVLVPLYRLAGDIFTASDLFFYGAALVGALSMLLFRGRIGLLPALIAGALAFALPDHVRVAFAEGNMPRTLAEAVLPVTLYFTLNVLERGGDRGPRRRDFVGVVVGMAVVVLCHAMMAAIFATGLGLLCLVYWQLGRLNHRNVFAAILALGTGLFLSGWWLLPSLTGGITEIDQTAASEALAYFPPGVAFNPALRLIDPEIFYVGLSFVAALVVAVVVWRRLTPLVRSLFCVGFVTAMASSTLVQPIYTALPLHALLWPIRFLSFADPVLLLATAGLCAALLKTNNLGRVACVALVVGMAADFQPSLSLIHLREAPPDVAAMADKLRDLPGWRVATVDLSRLGSAPTYLFTALGNREQVYGWAYQGATTAPVVASINSAITLGYPAFAVDRLDLLGADDVVALNAPEIPTDFRQELTRAGFAAVASDGRVDLYHRDGAPRADAIQPEVLGIGEGGANLAMIFPRVVEGSSSAVDDYDLIFLRRFRTVVLSHFTWHRQAAAEDLIRAYVNAGGNVIVDLTGAPSDVFAREPKLLGVYGEPIAVRDRTALVLNGQRLTLRPFPAEYQPWVAVTPQGLDAVTATFDYLGNSAAAVGTKRVGNGNVTFLGLNPIFQALTTHDPVTTSLLAGLLKLQPGDRSARQTVPLEGYTTGADGYHFAYDLATPGMLVLPFADHDGTVAAIDGRAVPSWSVSRLVMVDAPAGHHVVAMTTHPTAIYTVGRVATAVALAVVIGYLIGFGRILARVASPPRPLSTPRAERESPVLPSPRAAWRGAGGEATPAGGEAT